MRPKINDTHRATKSNGRFIPASVHYSYRKYDRKYEIVAQLYDQVVNDLDVNCGGQVTLDVQPNRDAALFMVRYFRGHEKG